MSQVVLSMCLGTWKPKEGGCCSHLKVKSLSSLYIFHRFLN